jgi:phage gp36-like protein
VPATLVFRVYSDYPANTALADPASVTLSLTGPDGAVTAAAWPGGTVIRDSTGTFHYTETFPGAYTEHWQATGGVPTQTQDGTFTIDGPAAYCNPDDVRAVLAGNATTTGTAATLSDDDLWGAIEEAQTEVDGRLASRYQTPFLTPPALAVTITRDIAGYLATLTYRKGAVLQPGDPTLLRYQRAQALLTQAAAGNLGFPEAPAETAAGEPTVANPIDGDLWTADDYRLRTIPAAWPGTADAPLRWW